MALIPTLSRGARRAEKGKSPVVLARAWITALILCCVFSGCAHNNPLPTYTDISSGDALSILRQRAEAIHTISAQGLITLTRPTGQSIRLDAAFVAKPPGNLHLRAWKLNRTVFDLTLTREGLWMLAPDDPKLRQKVESGKFGTVQFARAWALLTHDFFFAPLAIHMGHDVIILTRRDATTTIQCRVDRSTLTPRQFRVFDTHAHRQFTMSLNDYQMHDSIPYPSHMIAQSQFGAIQVRLRDIQINGALAPKAFAPSPRAEKMP